MQSSFPLYVLYLLLKVVVRTCLAIFYPSTRVIGKEYLELKGPTILATNHPNTLIDALNAASRADEQVFFLVNAGLYRNAFVARLFNALYCIPIQRPEDTGGKPLRNQEAFERCDRHLGSGGHLFIAPEGGSELEYRLRPLKTGTARIALSAEVKQGFQLDLRVLPIGFTYSDAPHMGSSLLVNVGQPLLASDYRELHARNAREAVLKYTEDLRNSLSALILDTRDKAEENTLRQMETLLDNEQPLPPDGNFLRNKKVLAAFRELSEADAPASAGLADRLAGYFRRLEEINVRDWTLASGKKQGLALRLLSLLLGFPFFLVGFLPNALPYFIPKWVERRLDLYIGYAATVKVVLGLVTFTLAYVILGWVATIWFTGWQIVLLLPCLLGLGYFAWAYARFFARTRQLVRTRRWSGRQPEAARALQEERQGLLDQLGSLMERQVFV